MRRRWLKRNPAPYRPAKSDAIPAAGKPEGLPARDLERVHELQDVLFSHDPIGLNSGSKTDLYRQEAEMIALRRSEAHSVADVRRITHEAFAYWFGFDMAGVEPAYTAIARDIWRLWSSSPDGRGD